MGRCHYRGYDCNESYSRSREMAITSLLLVLRRGDPQIGGRIEYGSFKRSSYYVMSYVANVGEMIVVYPCCSISYTL